MQTARYIEESKPTTTAERWPVMTIPRQSNQFAQLFQTPRSNRERMGLVFPIGKSVSSIGICGTLPPTSSRRSQIPRAFKGIIWSTGTWLCTAPEARMIDPLISSSRTYSIRYACPYKLLTVLDECHAPVYFIRDLIASFISFFIRLIVPTPPNAKAV